MTKRKVSKEDLVEAAGTNVYRGKLSKDGKTISFDCPVCFDTHTHGVTSDTGPYELMHRGAHCMPLDGDMPLPKELPNYVNSYYVYYPA